MLFSAYATGILERQKLKAPKTYLGAKLHMLRLIGYFKDLTLKEINDSRWSEYAAWRRKTNPNCSLFDDRKNLRIVLNSAFRDGLLPIKVELTEYSKPSSSGRELREDELKLLWLFCKDEKLKLQLEIALHMGLRKMEMLSMRWDQIDWSSRVMRLLPSDTKTRKGRVVPIPEHIYPELRLLFAKKRGAHVFPGKNDPTTHQAENRQPWASLRDRTRVKARWRLRHRDLPNVGDVARDSSGDLRAHQHRRFI